MADPSARAPCPPLPSIERGGGRWRRLYLPSLAPAHDRITTVDPKPLKRLIKKRTLAHVFYAIYANIIQHGVLKVIYAQSTFIGPLATETVTENVVRCYHDCLTRRKGKLATLVTHT